MATQMQLAREGKVTDAMKRVAEEERIPAETIRERVARGSIAICARDSIWNTPTVSAREIIA